jgi:hypothetical protein
METERANWAGEGKEREGERGKQRHSQREKRARANTGPGKSWHWRKERAILGIAVTYRKLQRAVAVPVAQPAGIVRYVSVLYDHSMVSARGPWLHTGPIPGSVINLLCFMMITLVCTKDILRNIYRVPCHIFWTKCMEYFVGL